MSTFCLCPYSGVHFACPPHKSPSWPNPKGTQHGAQGPEPQLCSTQPQNCSRSSSEKRQAGFFSKLPQKSYAVFNNRKHSTALSSHLSSTCRKPALNPAAQAEIPFHLPFIFIFTWKAEESWVFKHNKPKRGSFAMYYIVVSFHRWQRIPALLQK